VLALAANAINISAINARRKFFIMVVLKFKIPLQ
jgi:hypothetical protein